MSEPINDGGPAFPQIDYVDGAGPHYLRGMTLRDYFAAKAMQAIVTSMNNTDRAAALKLKPGQWQAITAEGSYYIADAMIAERSKHP